MPGENDVVVAAWNTVLFYDNLRFKHLLIDGLAPHSNAALDRQAYPEGSRVLDIGCRVRRQHADHCQARGTAR